MISSLPRIRRSISSSPASTLVCKSLASSLSSSALLSPSSRRASPSTSQTTLPLQSFNRFVGTGRHYTQYSKSGRIYTQNQLLYQFAGSRHYFSSDTSADEVKSGGGKPTKKKDLRESIERLKGESSAGGDNDGSSSEKSTSSDNINPHIEKITSIGTSFLRSLAQTWDELIASGQAKDINKKIGTPISTDDNKPNYSNDDEAADKYEKYKGSKDIMVIDPQEQLSAWERMERRLRDAPIIQGEIVIEIFRRVLATCLRHDDTHCIFHTRK